MNYLRDSIREKLLDLARKLTLEEEAFIAGSYASNVVGTTTVSIKDAYKSDEERFVDEFMQRFYGLFNEQEEAYMREAAFSNSMPPISSLIIDSLKDRNIKISQYLNGFNADRPLGRLAVQIETLCMYAANGIEEKVVLI